MKAVGSKLYKTKGQLAWIGDYTGQEDLDKKKIRKTIEEILKDEGQELSSVKDFSYDCKFICNHTTKEYLDLNKFYKNSIDKDGWCLCPLSLLTAIGNGRGGGDYFGINQEQIGIWAWDIISIEDNAPKDYTEFDIIFKEEY